MGWGWKKKMNKTKIEWTDYTWNPLIGCHNNCFYCYAQKFQKRFYRRNEVMYFPDRLNEPTQLNKESKIFVCSMGELFGDWIDSNYINRILDTVKNYPYHIFQFLTKNPKRYKEFRFPSNAWLGVTVAPRFGTSVDYLWENIDSVLPMNRNNLKHDNIRFVSYEPLIRPIHLGSCFHILRDDKGNPRELFEWVIIGAMTGSGSKKFQPKVEWIKSILKEADKYNIPIFMKNNLKPYWKGKLRQEFPK